MGIKLKLAPAENKMYTCRDIKAGYGLPFSCANDKLATQAFKLYIMTDPEGKVKGEYLELYRCGTFNRDTGEFKNHKMVLIEKGAKYAIQNSVQRENQNASTSGK